jgi:hypothetical protein
MPNVYSRPVLVEANVDDDTQLNNDTHERVRRWATDEAEYQVGLGALCDYYKSEAESQMTKRAEVKVEMYREKKKMLDAEQQHWIEAHKWAKVVLEGISMAYMATETKKAMMQSLATLRELTDAPGITEANLASPNPSAVAANGNADMADWKTLYDAKMVAIRATERIMMRAKRQDHHNFMKPKIEAWQRRKAQLIEEVKAANEEHIKLRHQALRDAETRGREHAEELRELARADAEQQVDSLPISSDNLSAAAVSAHHADVLGTISGNAFAPKPTVTHGGMRISRAVRLDSPDIQDDNAQEEEYDGRYDYLFEE